MFGLFRKTKPRLFPEVSFTYKQGALGYWRWYAWQNGKKIAGSLPVRGFQSMQDAYNSSMDMKYGCR